LVRLNVTNRNVCNWSRADASDWRERSSPFPA
jgi:hypothetical protein